MRESYVAAAPAECRATKSSSSVEDARAIGPGAERSRQRRRGRRLVGPPRSRTA